jgi:2-methylcitrate dehydratase PrpD
MNDDIGHALAAHIAGVRYDDLPLVAIEAAKKSVLDILGVSLAATGVPIPTQGIVDFVREEGGRQDCSVIGSRTRTTALLAAFANGALAHCLDYDDFTPWGSHATSSIFPAALAIAQRRGGVPGREMIAAVATGQDVFARLLRSVQWRKDWNPSTVFGIYAATAAAGRLAGLTRAQMAHALAVATMQASGTMEVIFGVGGDLRGLYAAFSAKAAVLAVLLAGRDITGPRTFLDGKSGFFPVYFRDGYDRAALLRDLGCDFLGGTTLYKPWPAVGTAHSHIHATIELVTRHALQPDDLAAIRIHVGDNQKIMCTPLDARRAPGTPVDAKFSLPFLVALAAVRRGVRIADFTPASLRDPRVRAVAQRVVPVDDPAYDWTHEIPLGRVIVTTRAGRTLDLVGEQVPGTPEAPMTWDRIAAKFAECAAVAATPPTGGTVERVQRMARELETLDDATELVRAVS